MFQRIPKRLTTALKVFLLGCFFLPLICAAENFVQVTVQINYETWDWWFFCDGVGKYPGEEKVPSIFAGYYSVRCVVGSNTWLIEYSGQVWKHVSWFNGTHIIEQTVSSNLPPFTEVFRSPDGNPSRPVRSMDRLTAGERIPWLALCSGSFFKREGRVVYPPDDFWKQTRLATNGWQDKTTAFKDGLGLPASILLTTATNHQPVFQYQTRQTTNVHGWNFPLEFYLVQYRPNDTNESWHVDATARGRITSIKVLNNLTAPTGPLRADWTEK